MKNYMPSLVRPSNGMAFNSLPVASELFNNRILVLDGAISTESCSALIQQILVLEHEAPEDEVTLLISSPGGDVYAGLGLIDVMNDAACPVRTVACGLVASMASVVLACGETRAAYPHAHILLHQLMSGMGGLTQQTDIDIVARHAALLRSDLDGLLAERSGLSVGEIHDLTERNCWLTAERALELGLIDEVL